MVAQTFAAPGGRCDRLQRLCKGLRRARSSRTSRAPAEAQPAARRGYPAEPNKHQLPGPQAWLRSRPSTGLSRAPPRSPDAPELRPGPLGAESGDVARVALTDPAGGSVAAAQPLPAGSPPLSRRARWPPRRRVPCNEGPTGQGPGPQHRASGPLGPVPALQEEFPACESLLHLPGVAPPRGGVAAPGSPAGHLRARLRPTPQTPPLGLGRRGSQHAGIVGVWCIPGQYSTESWIFGSQFIRSFQKHALDGYFAPRTQHSE